MALAWALGISHPEPMTRKPSQRGLSPAPLSLRVTRDERQLLETASHEGKHRTLSDYIRAKLFAPTSPDIAPISGVGLTGRNKLQLLAQILGRLGELQVLRNLSELADAARIGVLPASPDVIADIRTACVAVADIRDMLVRALCLRPPKEPSQ